MSLLMLAVVVLLPTCLLGLLALTARLEGWLARADRSATEAGEPRGAYGEAPDR
jgi:phosphatidylglycerophosphate synthase